MERRKAWWQRLRRLVSVRSSAAWPGGTGRMGFSVRMAQSTAAVSGKRNCPVQRLDYLSGAGCAPAGIVQSRSQIAGRRELPRDLCRTKYGLAANLYI